MSNINFGNDLNLSDETKEEILCIIPDCFKTIVTSFSTIENDGFYIEIRAAIFNKDEAIYWKSQLEEKSKTCYNLDSTFEDNTQKTVFKRVYHCMHNTRPVAGTINPHVKHTKCRAKLTINVKKPEMKRSKDVYLRHYPCKISLRYEHNHAVDYAHSLRYKKPSQDVEQKFIELFLKGHSPSTAIRLFKADLEENDNEKCPPSEWCCELYYNIFQKSFRGDISMQNEMGDVDNAAEMKYMNSNDLEDGPVAESEVISVEAEADPVTVEDICDAISQNSQLQVAEQNFLEAVHTVLENLRSKPDEYLELVNNFCNAVKQAKNNCTPIIALNNLDQTMREKSTEVMRKKGNVNPKIVSVNGKLPRTCLQDHPYSK